MRVGLGFLLLCSLFVVSFCNTDDQKVEIVGTAECADCQLNNFRTSQAFSGTHSHSNIVSSCISACHVYDD